ncbi:Hypothetical predicted protein [Cloeon dipterum]|uniref:Lipid-binding serum glycoprotein N-terminal domain-containing protein n=3 Tax=Cloeon dipterum TaxID=197152 RepID=A0A8S1BZ35_9INSE|nr:Hypothetical predicted protein [Cloeon dipterum]
MQHTRGCKFLLFAAAGLLLIKSGSSQSGLVERLRQCNPFSEGFDECMVQVLNTLNYLFPTGVPELGIPPFDPFFASEVETSRQNPLFSFNLKLTNVTESGWTNSNVKKFTSDLPNNRVTVDQYWDDKRLSGGYVFDLKILGVFRMHNVGNWNLTLLGFNQKTTLRRPPGEYDEIGAPVTKVTVNIQDVNDLKLHISNLFHGRRIVEYTLDNLINATWRPFYPFTKGLVNELVGKAFTKIFTRAFQSVPLNLIYGY